MSVGNIVNVPENWSSWDQWVEDRDNAWFLEALGDPWFTSQCQERWFGLRELIDDFLQTLDNYSSYILDDAEKCFERNGARTVNVRNTAANNGKAILPRRIISISKTGLRTV